MCATQGQPESIRSESANPPFIIKIKRFPQIHKKKYQIYINGPMNFQTQSIHRSWQAAYICSSMNILTHAEM